MTNNNELPPDPVWEIAWAWVQRQHEAMQTDGDVTAELARWLAEDPTHRKAYDKASRLWLLSGLLPPSTDIDNAAD
jgi:transmembrane sensor